MQILMEMEWSGNVRELRNAVERLVIMSPQKIIDTAELGLLTIRRGTVLDDLIATSTSFQDFKDRAEAAFIAHQLKIHNWNVSKTAEVLGMERSHLYTKIKKYGLERGNEDGRSSDEGS